MMTDFARLVALCLSMTAFAAAPAKSPFEVEIPPAPKFNPVLEKLPDSLPAYQMRAQTTLFAEPGLNAQGLAAVVANIKRTETIRVFVTDEEVSGSGQLIEPEAEAGLPISSQFVYVKLKPNEGHVRDRFIVAENKGPLKKVLSEKDVPVKGYLVKVNAEVELESEITPSISDSSHQYFRARVTRTLDLSEPGDVLLRGNIQSALLDGQGPRSSLMADIIGGESEERSGLYGFGSYIFIDKGAEDGVKVGDILPIYTDRRLRSPSTPIWQSPVSEGLIKIVHAASGVATGLVIRASAPLRQGDRTGGLAVNAPTEDHSSEDTPSEDELELSE